jgi:hypothetical protein
MKKLYARIRLSVAVVHSSRQRTGEIQQSLQWSVIELSRVQLAGLSRTPAGIRQVKNA